MTIRKKKKKEQEKKREKKIEHLIRNAVVGPTISINLLDTHSLFTKESKKEKGSRK